MKILYQIIPIILFLTPGCYTKLEKPKTHNNFVNPIQDQSVFLPDENYYNEHFNLVELFNIWVNSRELPDSIVWRPKNYKSYPQSRFRETIIFHNNGEYEELILSPNDAHYFQKYRWRLSRDKDDLIILFNSNAKIVKSMRIKKLDPISLELSKN